MRNGKRQIAINLSKMGGVITITCNLAKQGVSNILPPKTSRTKTAFLVVSNKDNYDTKK